MSFRTSVDISDALHRRLVLTKTGRLLYAYGKYRSAKDAFGFVTGFFPSDFGVFLRRAACSNEVKVHQFIGFLRRLCSRGLWWPLWKTVQQTPTPTDVHSDDDTNTETSNEINMDTAHVNDITGYNSDASSNAPSSSYYDSNSDSDRQLEQGRMQSTGLRSLTGITAP